MKLEPELSIRALWPLADGLRALGHDPSAILRRAGLTEVDLEDSEARLAHSDAIGFWSEAVSFTGDPDLGLHIAERASDQSFDLHICLMSASAKLGDAFRLLGRYQRLIHDASRVELTVESDRAWIRHLLPGGRPAPRQTAEFLLAAWLRAGRRLTGLEWVPEEVHFAHDEPDSTVEHRRVFQSPLRFGAPDNRLVFAAKLLERACVRADADLLAVLRRLADQALEKSPSRETWSDRVRNAAAEELCEGDPSMERIASRLGMSVRSLQRRLSEEGTTYSDLLDRLRRELAVEYLADPRVSIGEAAFLLGYGELASFYRAVQRWSGKTPGQWSSLLQSGKAG